MVSWGAIVPDSWISRITRSQLVHDPFCAIPVDKCQLTPYINPRKGWAVIHSFRHRGLQRLYERGDASRLHADHVPRLRLILTLLDAATKPSDMNFPGSGFHALRGNLRGFYAVRVSGNWRVIFRFDNADASDVDYLDYH